jgi:hypothetical protein
VDRSCFSTPTVPCAGADHKKSHVVAHDICVLNIHVSCLFPRPIFFSLLPSSLSSITQHCCDWLTMSSTSPDQAGPTPGIRRSKSTLNTLRLKLSRSALTNRANLAVQAVPSSVVPAQGAVEPVPKTVSVPRRSRAKTESESNLIRPLVIAASIIFVNFTSMLT